MKKLTLIILCISFTFFLISNCSESSNPTITDTEQAQQLQKRKKKPPSEKPVIEYFLLVDNNGTKYEIGIDQLPTVDFTETHNYKFKYKINHSSSEYRANLKLQIIYIPNDYPGIDSWYSSTVLENLKIVPGEDNILPWDGGPQIVDLSDITYYTSGGKFMDQKAGHGISDYIIDDEYYMYFSTDAEYKDDYDADVPNEGGIKIKAPSGDGEIYVNSIDIIPIKINKKRYFPQVTILISDDYGPCKDAKIMWNWGGNIIGDYYLRCCRTTDTNGKVVIDGPTYSTNTTGSIIFTLKRLSKTDYVYNPHRNNEDLGIWPVEPSDTLMVP